MNEMNELEKRLHCWAPRRPSAKLDQRLSTAFRAATAPPSPTEPGDPAGPHHFRLSWLAPAALALLVMGLMFNQRSLTAFGPGDDSRAWIAVALSNQSAAAWLPGNFGHDQNTIPAETFAWTNRPR